MDIHNHPCFNAGVRHTAGRIHLAVAPRCNVQCNFCSRKFDCANESRPGVTTSVMKPRQAVEHLSDVLKRVGNIAVVGIAGPGEPFANPEETLETLERVRAAFPDILLCVSSNGLMLAEYVSRLAALNVSHVTVTVNAVDPDVGANVYEWLFYNKKMYYGREGAGILLDKQTQAIRLLKKYGITVKINTVVIPRVNLHHVAEIARYVAQWGADIQNCIPLIPVDGTLYESLEEPSPKAMRIIRAQTSLHIEQMSHCARCRADAAGLLGNDIGGRLAQERPVRKAQCDFLKRPYIAAASSDGLTVNQHLGKASLFRIYRLNNGTVEFVETRRVPAAGCSTNRWDAIAELIPDCSALLVRGLGRSPYERLQSRGLLVESVDGMIRNIAERLFVDGEIPMDVLRPNGECNN
ncbi:MAG: radical SAM protein [Prevotellaceae bacterium]|jgi:nitrogen fixation protein NifB|nr:radical SAM protein [Prevotellaceae bacterium]